MTRLIVVQGSPAVGKTTLTRQLATELGMGIVAKDDFKELLYDKLGLPADRDQSRIYGSAVMQAMFALSRTLLEGGIDHLLESAFHPDLAEADFARLLNGLSDVHVVQLYCHTTPEVQAQRYAQRLTEGTRHPGHPDQSKDISEFVDYNQRYTQLALQPCIDVDTTSLSDKELKPLAQNIKDTLEATS
jgi:predicted kinase